jgi:hypothetical protein
MSMSGSPSASEKEEAQWAITLGLTDSKTMRTLQDTEESSKKKARINKSQERTTRTENERRTGMKEGCD